MTFNRLMPLLLATAVLTACTPESNISRDNAELVLSMNNRINQVAEVMATSFADTTIDNPSLQRFLTTGSATTVTGSCENEQGRYLFSKSDDSGLFSLVFSRCAGIDGGTLDGSLNGRFTTGSNKYKTQATGSLTGSKGDMTVDLHSLELDIDFSLNERNPGFSIVQRGEYCFQSRRYKGTVAVDTVKAVGMDSSNLDVSGLVTYTDLTGNVLTVEHSNSGVNLYFNENYYTTYSLNQWHQQFD